MTVNIWAVLLAAALSFLLGGLWYSPLLLGKLWSRAAGQGEMQKEGHPASVFAVSYVFAAISSYAFAQWLGPDPELSTAVVRGLAVGFCFVGASFGINYQFANRSMLLWAIDAGYHTIQFLIYGLVIGLWH